MNAKGKWIAMAVAGLFALSASSQLALAKKDKEHKGGKDTAKEHTTAGGPEIGAPAPTFTLSSFDGKTYSLNDYKNKIVVLEWFNKDCPVCQAHCENMKKLAKTYTAKGVIWLAVDSTNFRKNPENAAYAKEHHIDYPILADFDGKVGKEYRAKTTPHMYVINKGTLAYMGAIDDGAKKNPKNYVAAALDELLADKTVTTTTTKSYGCSVKYKK